MPISDIPILSMLRERMQWHQARQQVLAENVANADTPNYQASDLARRVSRARCRPLRWALAQHRPGHIAARSAAARSFETDSSGRYEIRPRGNSVTHEDEMMKVAVEPDGLRGGDIALHAQPRADQNGGRQIRAAHVMS